MWFIYLISSGSRTYIGSTTDPIRRLRQHNGEIRGGAKSTQGQAGKWTMVCCISGLANRSIACRWEKLLKSRARGLSARRDAFLLLVSGHCPISVRKNARMYDPPTDLSLHADDVSWISPGVGGVVYNQGEG